MYCTDIPSPFFYVFSSSAEQLVYYSHLPAMIISLLLGFYVYFKNKRLLASKILFAIVISFSIWIIFSLISWTNNNSTLIMFSWSFFVLLDFLLFVLSFYFVYAYIEKKDVSLKIKALFSFLILPVLLLIPTTFNLRGFDLDSCESTEGMLFFYVYLMDVLVTIGIVIYSVYKYFTIKDETEKRQIVLLTAGILFFLLAFSWTNIAASVTLNWKVSQFGLFGMPVFIGFLVYLIVKFKAFEIKLIGAQALMVSLVILVGSQFFFVKTPTNMVLTGIALVLSVIFGFFLIKSVKSEIQRKEELQYMADKLAQSNDKLRQLDNAKTEFISIASHQLRTPLTAIKGFIALILEGSYGDISSGVSDALIKAQVSTERLINLVEDLLNVSRIESGRMEYKMVDQDITKLLMELDGSFAIVSKNKGLSFETKLPTEKLPNVSIDDAKMREVISNLIDNALKYTEKGGVTVRVERGMTSTFKSYGENEVNKQAQQYQGNARPSTNGYIRVIVSDTGIGIPATELPYLFSKFSRGKDTTRLHVGGTGLGLYVGKNIVEAHGGKVWAESDGDGLGSRFIVELPVG